MPALSLHAAETNLHRAMRDYTAAHDAATADGRVCDRLALEVALTMIEQARKLWGSENGLSFLDCAERHVKFALGGEESMLP